MTRSLFAAAALAALSVNVALAATPAATAPAKKTPHHHVVKKAAPAAPEVPLTEGQLAEAQRVLTGEATCEGNVKINVAADSKPGHFRVTVGRTVYTMVPKETTTGAVDLVDTARDVEWMQIPSKSMLLDNKHMKRLATECREAAQLAEAGK